MDTLQRLRRANREIPVPDPPQPAGSEDVEIYNDQTRDGRRVTYAEFVKDWQSRGYRLLVGQRLRDMPQPVERGRAIIPPQGALRSTTQTGQWAETESAARAHLDTFAGRLAERIDRPPVPRAQLRRGERAPSPARAGDIAQAALTAEAACMLFDLVDSLQGQIRALQAAQDERR